MKKYASMVILSASLAPTGKQALRRFAHRHQFTYDPRPGYLYVRSRAISSRCNDNYDEFPAEEIKKAYATFVGKPVFVNHHNDNHRRARGVIIDAALHEDKNPDGSPDTWAEVLMEVDAVKFPKLAKAILAGHVDRTSMGTDVAFSKCSVCNNKATNPTEYCQHIPKMKGQRIYRTTASGKKEGILVREKCYGLGFFENSLLVEDPADPTAFFTGVDDHSGLSSTASKTAEKEWHLQGQRPDPTNALHAHLVNDHAIDPHLISKRHPEYLHALHHETVHDEKPGSQDGVLNPNTMEGHSVPMHSNTFHIHELGDPLSQHHSKKTAYNEIMAPADVDTLRDEECPVCGEADSYDGNECQVCGFITPPKMFLDPDVDMAKKLDLRKDVAEAGAPGEDLNGDGMPDSIPGSTVPGSDATGEVDPTMLDENGMPIDPETGKEADPYGVGQAVDEAMDPNALDENGLPADDQDPEQIDPETGLPVEQNDDIDPNSMAPDGQSDSFGSEAPGDAGDGVPDLVCPSCGFQSDSAHPQSVNTADPAAIPPGAAAGDVCPQCQGGLLESISDAQQMATGRPV